MQGQQQQAYDRGTTIFSPDGRLYQVEYAREAVKRGTTSVGVRTADGVVLAAKKRSRSPMLEPSSVEKLHKVDDHIGIASAGHVADARRLIDYARQQTQTERLRYGEAIGVETLTKEITDYIQQFTQVGGARPFGVAMIVAGVEDGEPRLFETDPSGTPYEWKALSVGESRSEIREYLETEFDDGLTLEAGIDLAFGALAEADDDDGFEPADVALATIPTADPTYTAHDTETVADYLAEFDYLAEETDEE
ncbi:MAG: proteasome endopeptidase complex, archaeal, alpha subunit [halophilic archaeon J07HB67]|jgi:proteasome endopeptidase complex, archaeal, alpha subunit|nr:MAG: proteasome endopeptidase complex, archaeal, alpha subunit [halophilic archaeon J07HB67]